MNSLRLLPLVILLGSAAFSQTLPDNCPIEMKARMDSAGKVVPVENGQIEANVQRLRITLSSPKSAGIAATQITVYGFPVGGRIAPAVLYLPSDPAEIRKTFTFDRAVPAGQSATIELWVRDFSTVTSLNLDSVAYADGSSWHPQDHKYCQAFVSSSIERVVKALSR